MVIELVIVKLPEMRCRIRCLQTHFKTIQVIVGRMVSSMAHIVKVKLYIVTSILHKQG